MLENLKKYKIVLASNSPRRRNLLSGLDIDFEVRVISDIDESYPDSIDSMEIPLYIARSKAEAYKPTMADDELLITADTIVWTFDGVMGKACESRGSLCYASCFVGSCTSGNNRCLYHDEGQKCRLFRRICGLFR